MSYTIYELRKADLDEKISSLIGSLHMSRHLSDMSLVCKNGMKVPTHRFLLASCSPSLDKFFKDKPEDKELLVSSFSAQTVTLLLEVLYKGLSLVNAKEVEDCEALAKQLGMFPLQSKEVRDESTVKIVPPLEPPPAFPPFFIGGEGGSSQVMFPGLELPPMPQVQLPPKPQIQQNKRPLLVDSGASGATIYEVYDVPTKKHHVAQTVLVAQPFSGKCHACPTKYFSINYLCYAHEMLAHSAMYPICPFCCKPYLNPAEVDVHVQAEHAEHFLIVTNQKEKDLRGINLNQLHHCNFCEKKFTQKMIDAHKFIMHKISFNGCPICAKKFPNRKTLYYHAKGLHKKKLQL